MKLQCDRRFAILFTVYFIAMGFLLFWNFEQAPVNINKTLFGIEMDKYIHFAIFLPFPLLLYGICHRSLTRPWHAAAFAIVTFLLGALLAGATEYIQGLLPWRMANAGDFEADTLSVAAGCIAALIIDLSRQFRTSVKNIPQ